MGTGYSRKDTTNNIADGNIVNASDLDNEFDGIAATFDETSGHTHDGTVDNGAPITKVGPAQDVVVSTSAVTPKTDNAVDLGSSLLEFKDLYIDGTANIDSLVADTADINAGTIDGAVIGGSSAAAGTFTTVNATTVNTTNLDLTNLEVTNIKAKDGTASATIADSTGVLTVASAVLTTADINGGTIDGATIATSDITVGSGKTLNVSAGTLTLADNQISGDKVEGGTINATTITTLTSTTVNATTVDTTNIEVTNIKAKDGTAAATIANATGVVTIPSSILTTADINGGTIDGTSVGASSASTGAFTSLTSSSTTTLNGTTIPASKTLVVTTDIGSTVQAYDADLAAFAAKTAPTGVVVGTTDTQTLTNKTISADNNTLSGIAASSFVLSNSSGNIDGSASQKVIPAGVVVGTTDTQTLTNKTIDGESNTLTNLPLSNITEPVRHSVRPSLLLDFANTKTLDPRITFTRASTGTYYDGKTVAKAEENLLTYSQEFDNATWTKTRASVSANAVAAPDGTTTAESLIEDSTASASHFVGRANVSLVADTYTWSVYAKANTRNWLILNAYDTTNRRTWFDLSGSGAVGTTVAGATATITSVGNSWFRLTVTRTASATSTGGMYLELATADNSTSYSGDGTSGMYIWGAQLEQRSSVTAYTATTTQPITNYIPVLLSAPANTARFEHNPVTGESLGLEIEEQRTNLQTYSEQFDNAAWAKNASATITANQFISPDGTLSADLMSLTGTGGSTQLYKNTTVTNATAYNLSVYVKYYSGANGDFLFSMASDTTRGMRVTVSPTSVVLSEVGVNVTNSSSQAIGNGWYRINLTVTSTSTTFEYNIFRPISYGGTGVNSFAIWGAQLEAGAFPTSYIPTVASQVTRSADSASMTGTNFSSWYRADEGTVYAESKPIGGAFSPCRINDGTANNRISFVNRPVGTSTGDEFALIATNNVTQASLSGQSYASNTKGIISYALNNIAGTMNGTSVSTDSIAIIPVVTQLVIGFSGSGLVNRFTYYPKRLTNAELQGLTTV